MTVVDLAPKVVEIKIRAGDEFAQDLALFASEGGPPLNLTGYAFAGGVTPAAGGAEVAFAFDIDAPAGTVTFSLTEAETAALGAGAHRWRLAWTEPGSILRTLFTGTFRGLAP